MHNDFKIFKNIYIAKVTCANNNKSNDFST